MSLYDDLGITSSATTDEIKAAFKKLALKHHPDRGGNEEDFKRIQKAYETLNDEQKRRIYDHGEESEQNFGFGGNFSNMFEQMFGFRQNFSQHSNIAPETAPVITINLDLSLEDMYFLKTRELEFTCRERCTCVQKCPVCNGRGVQVKMMRMGPVIQQLQSQCSRCSGLGASGSCNNCQAKGWKNVKRIVKLNITRNVSHNGTMTIKGIGHHDLHSQNHIGDISIIFKIKKHSIFTKEENNLKMETSITWEDSVCGTSIEIEHFGGNFTIDTKEFGVIQPDSEHRVPGKGFDSGDLIIKFKVHKYPKLSNEQLEKIKEILSNK